VVDRTVAGSDGVDIPVFIDAQPIGRFLWGLVGLCALTLAFDGFDTQAIGYVAPSLVKDWNAPKSALGPIFSAGLFGLLIGSLVVGPLGDRVGRRSVLLGSTLWFGCGALATTTAGSLDQLFWLRFLTGLGLGGALPTTVALVSEYAPKRRRATLITIMFCGFSIGAALGGVFASQIVPRYGWRAVFLVGGIGPLMLVPLMFWTLPESLRVLVGRRDSRARIQAIFARMNLPRGAWPERLIIPAEDRLSGFPVLRLGAEGRAAPTLCLWVAFFMNLLSLYFITNWLPIIGNDAGLTVDQAVLVTALFQVGGTVGAVIVGRLTDSIRPQWILGLVFLGAAGLIAGMGSAGSRYPLLAALSFGAGFCVVGGQTGANALAGTFYPASVRSTGVGWALGIGRFGAVVGPLIGGMLLAAKLPTRDLFAVGAIPSLCAALAILAMGLLWRRRVDPLGEPMVGEMRH
jgi:MFS transporter, AAHS family, 4-hydroxybenzoate transporter